MTFQDQINKLAQFKQQRDRAKEMLDEKQQELEADPDYQFYKSMLVECNEQINELDAQIRADAEQHFEITGEKKAHPALGIRMTAVLDYDIQDMKDWCLAFLPQALNLNKRLFEKHAKAVAETAPVPDVTIEQQPKATIAKDLGAYL